MPYGIRQICLAIDGVDALSFLRSTQLRLPGYDWSVINQINLRREYGIGVRRVGINTTNSICPDF